MILQRLPLLGLFVPMLFGATIDPIPTTAITLSGFQSTATVDINGYGTFSGFAFDPRGPMWDVMPNGDTWAILKLGGGGQLWGNPIGHQSIEANASVNYTVSPGFHAVQVMLYGSAMDDGASVTEGLGTYGPCATAISGSNSVGYRTCTITAGQSGGTVDAYMYIHSDVRPHATNLGTVSNPYVAIMVVHNPEPAVMIMVGLGLVGLAMLGRARNRT